jgi:cytochrome oxidase Cu insertion factor (SCO1/SenC/PrrC family)
MKQRFLLVFACLLLVACNNETAKKMDQPDASKKSPTAEKLKNDNGKESAPAIAESSPEPVTADEKFAATKKRFDKAMSEFRTAYTKAKTSDEKETIFKEDYPDMEVFGTDFMAIAEEFPDDEVAVEALGWIAQRARGTDIQKKAIDTMLDKHIKSDKIASLCGTIGYGETTQNSVDQLNRIVEESPHDNIKGLAVMYTAKLYAQAMELKPEIEDKKPEYISDEEVEFITGLENGQEKVNQLYATLKEKYGDEKPSERSKRTFASIADAALFEINNLAIGMEAPEIEGDDLDGKSFKLSDYRGKVVMLDFWGDW